MLKILYDPTVGTYIPGKFGGWSIQSSCMFLGSALGYTAWDSGFGVRLSVGYKGSRVSHSFFPSWEESKPCLPRNPPHEQSF